MITDREHFLNQYSHRPRHKVSDLHQLAPWVCITIVNIFEVLVSCKRHGSNEQNIQPKIVCFHESIFDSESKSKLKFQHNNNNSNKKRRNIWTFNSISQVLILWIILVYEWITRMRSLMPASGNSIIICSSCAVWYIWIRPLASQLYHLFCPRPHVILKCHQKIKAYWPLPQCLVSRSILVT